LQAGAAGWQEATGRSRAALPRHQTLRTTIEWSHDLLADGERTAQLLGAADTVRTEAGANVMPFLVPLLAQAEKSAVAALGATRFEAEIEAGKRLGRDTALRLALGKSAHVAAAASDNASAGLLGKREADVAGLVADGLTNRQIGARLFISERTVDSHVRSILNKLGFNSRAQIAAWMASSNQ
jgi:DNA-binding NarL/FixJ family response regulator